MLRVLQCVASMEAGGIQSFIMNVYRNIDRNKIQFDFLLHKRTNSFFEPEIERMGGKIYYIPSRHDGIIKNKIALDSFFRQHSEYEVVHLHESSLSYIEPLRYAKKHGVNIRIMHSHNTHIPGSKIHYILHKLNSLNIDKYATHKVACGKLAGEWMFGKEKNNNFNIIYNGISIKNFQYDEHLREITRKQLRIKDEIVIGHIGRFMTVKNHEFIIKIFYEILKCGVKSKLMLIGEGELFEHIKEMTMQLNIQESVLFLGVRSDVTNLLQAMDIMLMPSFFEGFPVTAIEAQANGLPVVLSNTITTEALIKDNTKMLSLDKTPKAWAEIVLNSLSRIPDNTILYDKGFDISYTVNELSNIYLSNKLQ